MKLKLLLILLYFTKIKTADSENLKKPGFLYTMPKVLLAGRNETACLSLHSSFLPIKITVDLKIKQTHFYTNRIIDSEHSCFEIGVPPSPKPEAHFASVKVQIEAPGATLTAHNQDPVVVHPDNKITFIETDRMTYKSKDIVKFRILTLGNDLLPILGHKIPLVRMRNPLGAGVAVWENVTTELGLAHLEHQLPPDPIEGKWRLEVGEEVRVFEVAKYVLPRFKVQIIHPKTIYIGSRVTIKVCGRYSYGEMVKGSAFLRLSSIFPNFRTFQSLKKMSNGCGEFVLTPEDFSYFSIKKLFPLSEPKMSVLITATVTEQGTNKIELAVAKSVISLRGYSLKFVKKQAMFLPGLPYQGFVQLNSVNVDLKGHVIEICYNIAIKKSWNYLNNEQCRNFTLQGTEKFIPFHVLPLKNNVIHLQLNARSLNFSNIIDNFLVVRLFSPSLTYITIDQIHHSNACKSVQQFAIQYTTEKLKEHENVTFFYMVKSRGHIYKLRKITHNVRKSSPNYFSEFQDILGTDHKHTRTSSIAKFTLKFKLDEIFSNYQLLIYYVSPEGELASAVKEVEVEPCLKNKVEANWSHKHIAPGATASLLIESKSESLCSVITTDKAVTFMDDLRFLHVKSLLKPFQQPKETPESGRKSCIPPVKKNREKRFVYPFSEDFDAYDIFEKFGIVTITNFKIVTKPCYTGPIPTTEDPVSSLTDQYDIQNEDNITPIRSYFPETWLWEIVPVRSVSVIHRTLPHTITTWTTNVMCVSATEGVGFSKITEITTFRPFFVDILTPYSIKRGETLYLHAIIFNYLTYNIPIRITLGTSNGLKLIETKNQKSFSYCISSNNTATHIFELKGIEVGDVNVTVVAELDPNFPGHCGPEIIINKRDVVFKTLKVEPEGYPIITTKSALLCASGTTLYSTTRKKSLFLGNITWALQIPSDTVAKTAKSILLLNGDILGQTIQNLDDLIAMPTGCGEQIMANLAPNLYILKYLNETKQLSSSLRHKIARNLKIGYQRILNYIHKDGSFSAFGYHDPSGSMFLTAFVVRTLQHMKKLIYVDQKIIERAVLWILNHQLENGCFSTMSHVFQDMGGTSSENSTAALTAYVIISLLDGDIQIPENVKTNAKYCIRGYYDLDRYTLAISSYALLKINWFSEAERMLKKLFQVANHKDNMMWWTNREVNGSESSDIEVTSYILLALIQQKNEENLAKAHSIVQWLSSKQGHRGSFKSTQDTVVALDALTKYSQFFNHKTDIKINIVALDSNHNFRITDTDRLKSKKIPLKNPANQVRIEVQGQGCVLVQAITSYNVKELRNGEAFKLDMEVLPVSNIDQCSITTLAPCFKYNGIDQRANMAILEVGLPSGYQADRTSLYKLIDESSVKMFEELEEKIVLYLTKLGNRQMCVNFNINENAIVKSRTNSTVKLYDYYKPEYQVSQFYKIKDNCLTNSTIPDISQIEDKRKKLS
ncbi:alpha-2-macroglobulin-like isoform X2 [Tribolium madens]|uniref:alpha-2-macroglobulin-like isoform X2 n=1 Tax=Tribolium madens TaxID=41895 RepID=UPI001CF73ACF|nr:alpha-2-macroglobulin-like isoform X2 [Tribolium madens]